MDEIWKDVTGYEGLYQVSNFGRVRSLARHIRCHADSKRKIEGRVLQQVDRGNGYWFVTFGKGGNQTNMNVHRLVAEAFVPGFEMGKVVNHKDENPKNNHFTNLEWVTQKENTNYGTAPMRRARKRARAVYQISQDGEIIKMWNRMTQIQEDLGFSIGNISACCHGKRENANGYKWRLAK